MAIYTDANGKEWRIEFDAANLYRIRHELKVDLADLSASGYETIENDEIMLVKVLSVILGKQVVQSSRGEALENAVAAIEEAAADFFPQRKWSAIQSNLKKRQTMRAEFADLKTAMDLMPEGMREGATGAMADLMRDQMEGIDSQASAESTSAGGREGTQSQSATDSPGYAGLTAVG